MPSHSIGSEGSKLESWVGCRAAAQDGRAAGVGELAAAALWNLPRADGEQLGVRVWEEAPQLDTPATQTLCVAQKTSTVETLNIGFPVGMPGLLGMFSGL